MGLLGRLLLGDGTLKSDLRAALESEGLVLIREGLSGSVRYTRFKAPGRYHNGKITPERMGLGISEERFVVYCRSGRVKLMDTAFSNPRLSAVDVSLKDDERVAIRVDYDRLAVPRVSGEVTVVVNTPNAASIVDELRTRFERARAERGRTSAVRSLCRAGAPPHLAQPATSALERTRDIDDVDGHGG